MDVLFLCGVFAKENEVEVIAQAKKSVEFSANQMLCWFCSLWWES